MPFFFFTAQTGNFYPACAFLSSILSLSSLTLPHFPEYVFLSCGLDYSEIKRPFNAVGSIVPSADTQIYTKSTDFKNPYAHVHATHTEQRFTALEMLPLLQIYSLKSERCPSWDGPGGVW